MKKVLILIIGAFAFALSKTIWLLFFDFASSNWILEPTPGILLCAVILILSVVGCSYKFHRDTKNPFLFLFGVWISITAMLLLAGPGNLWPIVLAIDYVMVTPIVYAGWFMGIRLTEKK
jgi:hypothetical protein